MDDEQRAILKSHLKTTEKVPPQHRLEAVEMGLATHLGLYQQEGNSEGASLYRPLVELVRKAKNVAELEALIVEAPPSFLGPKGRAFASAETEPVVQENAQGLVGGPKKPVIGGTVGRTELQR